MVNFLDRYKVILIDKLWELTWLCHLSIFLSKLNLTWNCRIPSQPIDFDSSHKIGSLNNKVRSLEKALMLLGNLIDMVELFHLILDCVEDFAGTENLGFLNLRLYLVFAWDHNWVFFLYVLAQVNIVKRYSSKRMNPLKAPLIHIHSHELILRNLHNSAILTLKQPSK